MLVPAHQQQQRWLECLHLSSNSQHTYHVLTLRPRQNGRRFADDTFKRIFFNDNVRISSKISLKFVPKGPINNIPSLVQIQAWRRPGDKPLSEPMMVSLLTHICVTRPQWVIAINKKKVSRETERSAVRWWLCYLWVPFLTVITSYVLNSIPDRKVPVANIMVQ